MKSNTLISTISLLSQTLSTTAPTTLERRRSCAGQVCGTNCCTFITYCGNAAKSLCCLSGDVEVKGTGICCPPGSSVVGGQCCPAGGVNVGGKCCIGKNCGGTCCPGVCSANPFLKNKCLKTKKGCLAAGGSGDFCKVAADCPGKARYKKYCDNGCCTYTEIVF